MKVIARHPGYAHNLLVVQLEKIDEYKTDLDLITEADNRSNYKDRTVRHFGGTVRKCANNIAEIKVYTD
jgi:hypothetical protein